VLEHGAADYRVRRTRTRIRAHARLARAGRKAGDAGASQPEAGRYRDAPREDESMSTAPDAARDWQSAFGPLAPLLRDPSVTEIMVNGPAEVFTERAGRLQREEPPFKSAAELQAVVVELARTIGRPLDEHQPMADGRLPDGSRINCVIPPVAVDGPALTVRKFSDRAITWEQLVQGGALSERMAFLLEACVRARLNVVVSGGTGSGKTTLLNVLASFIPPEERIVTIEDTAELRIPSENRVRLEARPPSATEEPIPIRMLVINALRMRPDRIVVGECRGAEAFDMLTAMNTGHSGSMTTVHANSARDCLRRLETMVLTAGTDMPLRAVREHVAAAIQLIVQTRRDAKGARRVAEIVEVGGMEGEVILTQPVFSHGASGFEASRLVPRFVERFQERGVPFPRDFFAR
jgi:pilus assembly protein CpaF